MKISWGTGIVIAFVLFISFILFFVLKVQSDSKYDNELVVEDYYKQERGLEVRLEKEQNAANMADKVQFSIADDYIEITFPEGFDPKGISGKVFLYRPSAQKLDFSIPISITSPTLLIPKTKMAEGRWDIMIDWQYDGKAYINKEMISL